MCVGVMLAFNELSVYNWLILIHILCKNGLSKMEAVTSGVLVEYCKVAIVHLLVVDVDAVINGGGYSCLGMEDEPLFCLPPPSHHAPFVM